jgi:hypothetical protein
MNAQDEMNVCIPDAVLQEAAKKINELQSLLQPYLENLTKDGKQIFSKLSPTPENPRAVANYEHPVPEQHRAVVKQLNACNYWIMANKYAVVLTVT